MTTLTPGSALGPYVIEDEIGRGGFATVYRADDARFGRPVAIKVLAAHLARDDEAVERFLAEARALRSVDDDSVVSVFDIAGTDDDRPFMVLQYADRGTLLERILNGWPATDAELGRIVSFLERALGALHALQMVHRDVKPSNVLITTANTPADGLSGLLHPDDRLVLGDLGLVKDLSSGSTVTRGSGSAAYAAPEQRAVVSRVDTRTDIYAASAVIAEAALGRTRRADESWDDMLQEIGNAGRPKVAAALEQGLSEDPADRPASIEDWSAAVRGAVGPGGALTSNRLARSDKPTSRWPMLAWVVGALALVAGAAAIVITARDAGVSSKGSREVAIVAAAPAPVTADNNASTVADAATATAVLEPTPAPEPTPQSGQAASAQPGITDGEACGDPDRGVAEGLAPSELMITDVSDTTMTVEWAAVDQAYSIFVDGSYFDNARKLSRQYVVEGLSPGINHDVVMTAHNVLPEEGAHVCAVTALEPTEELPVGVTMATQLVATAVTSTSAELAWVPAASGGRYTLYSGTLADGKKFPDIIGAGGAEPGSSSYVFTDLEEGATVVVGLRTISGENQSGLAWVEIDLSP